jgi:hypothetical protein
MLSVIPFKLLVVVYIYIYANRFSMPFKYMQAAYDMQFFWPFSAALGAAEMWEGFRKAKNPNWIMSPATNLDCIFYWCSVHQHMYCICAEIPNTYLSFFCTILYLSISIFLPIPHLPHHLYIPPHFRKQKKFKKGKRSEQFAAFCLFFHKSPIYFSLLGGNGKTLKLQRLKNYKKGEHTS